MQRFEILYQAKMIDKPVLHLISQLRQQLLQSGIDCKMSQVEMLLTHLAMALMRIRQNNIETVGLDAQSMQEIQSSEVYPQLLAYHHNMLALIQAEFPDLVIPESENSYLIANWYSLSLIRADCFKPIVLS
ncbi:PRD domain-containing protein [Testudinibacter sp. TR-2022]|uniref:PRD domain-containing protein n=1 Tax=Testudinibacter sp. TR-2022 TaxID=2585029 RepID=UPI001119D610|nr:PRD domain-containing protein [Testudinibacter sp. TR-2022]TNH05768.1 PRD domain-containing protein [Pasteurellaceae bacterium Phil11]TNH22213.1 PRD domain-containing protein [Testudinibacter sp. TR-2022]TNH25812.1 PRD domain-containing protein [Testudinibacter sp. TR-2022]